MTLPAKSLKDIELSALPQLRPERIGAPVITLTRVPEVKLILAAWGDGSIGLVSETGVRALPSFAGPIDKLAVYSATSLGAVVRIDTVTLIDISTGKPLHERNFKTRIQDVIFSPDGSSLLLGGADGRVYRWHFPLEGSSSIKERGRIVERYIGSSSTVSALLFHPEGRVFFSGDWRGVLAAWQLYDADDYGGEYDKDLILGDLFTARAVRQTASGEGRIEAIEQADQFDGKLWLARQSGVVEWWSIRGLTKRAEVQAHPGLVYSLAVSPDGSVAVSVGRDGILKVLQPQDAEQKLDRSRSFQLVVTHQVTVPNARALSWLNGSTLIVADGAGKLHTVPLSTFQPAPPLLDRSVHGASGPA